jgi:hypothetical protein
MSWQGRVVEYVYVGLTYTGNVRVRGVRTRTRDFQVYAIQVYVTLYCIVLLLYCFGVEAFTATHISVV